MHRVIIVGSPRTHGRSAALADELFNACIEECPEDGVSIVSVASTEVRPCVGCDACRALKDTPLFTFEEGDPLLPAERVVESDALFHHCIIKDDMAEVRKHLDAADELIVVTPVYFASAPAQLKALLDRLQPYYWTPLRKAVPRPATIHVVGEGGDPFGFDALIDTLRSALYVAGFRIDLVLDWVGKIDVSGEIQAEPDIYEDIEEGVVEDADRVSFETLSTALVASEETSPLDSQIPSSSSSSSNGSSRSSSFDEARERTKLSLSQASTKHSGNSQAKRAKSDSTNHPSGSRSKYSSSSRDKRSNSSATKSSNGSATKSSNSSATKYSNGSATKRSNNAQSKRKGGGRGANR